MTDTMSDDLFRKRILLVEDEHFMRSLLVQALNSVGFASILEAEDGRHALLLLQRHAVDIVVSDIEMKHINGFDLVREIRMGETGLPREIPVIFLTGLSDVSTLSSAAQLDVQGFLVKPVSARQLREKIAAALHKEIHFQPVAAYHGMTLVSTVSDQPSPSGAAADPVTPAGAADRIAPAAARTPSGHGSVEPEAAGRRLDVLMLAEGMTLQQDVHAHGLLLLKAGIRLMPSHIAVLQDMRGLLDDRRILIIEAPPP